MGEIMNDCFIAFWSGGLCGVVVGIMAAAISAALMEYIERKDNNDR